MLSFAKSPAWGAEEWQRGMLRVPRYGKTCAMMARGESVEIQASAEGDPSLAGWRAAQRSEAVVWEDVALVVSAQSGDSG